MKELMKLKIVALLVTCFWFSINASEQAQNKSSCVALSTNSIFQTDAKRAKKQADEIAVFFDVADETEIGKFSECGFEIVKPNDKVSVLLPYIHSQFKLQNKKFKLSSSGDSSDQESIIANLDTQIKNLPSYPGIPDQRFIFIYKTE